MAMEAVPEQPTVPVFPVAVEEAALSLYVAAVMCVWAAYISQLVSSSPAGASEAVPEPAPDPEVVPEPPIFPVSPEMAKRAVFNFYVLAVLRAWKTHMLASDHGPVYRPEPVADPEAIPEQHVLPVMTTEAIPESAPAPGPPEFTSKPWNSAKETLVPILKAGQTHAHYSLPGLSLQPPPGHPPGFLFGWSLPGPSLRPRPGHPPGFLFGWSLPGSSLRLRPGPLPGLLYCLSLPGSTLPPLPGPFMIFWAVLLAGLAPLPPLFVLF